MITKLVLLASYFLLTPIFLISLILYQSNLSHDKFLAAGSVSAVHEKQAVNVVPKSLYTSSIEVTESEARVDVLKAYFARYDSPLSDYAQAIVDTADNYGLDWRLLPAIAMQESTLCKKIPKDSHNCWGFGIYGGKVTKFSDYGEAINVITKAMARDYHALGLKDPSQIVAKYTPANTNDWSGNVSFIMDEIGSPL